jgi:hypothetical protein
LRHPGIKLNAIVANNFLSFITSLFPAGESSLTDNACMFVKGLSQRWCVVSLHSILGILAREMGKMHWAKLLWRLPTGVTEDPRRSENGGGNTECERSAS